MITYSWDFTRLISRPHPELSDTINGVFFRLTAADGDYTASMEGSLELSAPDAENFKPYAEITKNDLIRWTEAAISAVHVELDEKGRSTQTDGFDGNALELYRYRLAQQIEKMKAPKPKNLAIPV